MAAPQPPRDEGLPMDTTSATISPAQCDQPSEIATLETPSLPIATNTAHNTHTTESSVRQRLKAWVRRLPPSLRHKQDGKNMWKPDGYVYLVVGNDEIRRHVKILLDPQSPENVISTRCLSRFPGYTYSASAGVPIGHGLTCETYFSIAEVEIRWNGINDDARRFTGPYFRDTVHELSTCHVMDTDGFDLIIGQPTIDELKLFKRNKKRIIAAWRGCNNSVNNDNVDDEQHSAEERRKKAKDDKKRREQEEKDKKANK